MGTFHNIAQLHGAYHNVLHNMYPNTSISLIEVEVCFTLYFISLYTHLCNKIIDIDYIKLCFVLYFMAVIQQFVTTSMIIYSQHKLWQHVEV